MVPMMAVLLMKAGDDVGIDRERIAKYNRLLQRARHARDHGLRISLSSNKLMGE
jgi:hypothetical protein